jgi:hypothetical protein
VRSVIEALVAVCVVIVPASSVDAQTQLSTEAPTSGTHVSIYADGAIRGVALGEEDNATAGTGSLGIRVAVPNKIYYAVVNVASTVDTITGNAGSFILSPANGSALRSGILDLRFPNTFGKIFGAQAGLHTYASASQSTWQGTVDTAGTVVVGLGALLYHDVANGQLGDEPTNRIRLSIEAGPSMRIVGGDVSAGARDGLRTEVLGTTQTKFAGLELGMQIEFGIVTAGFQFYLYDDFKRHTDVRGITGGQFVAGFSIGGPIVGGQLK